MAASRNSAGSDPGAPPVVLLGVGFTTGRLARRLIVRKRAPVYAVARRSGRFAPLAALGVRVQEYCPQTPARLPKGATLVHTIPPLQGEEQARLRAFIGALEPRRVVYISSTSVYGEQLFVTADSPAAPSEPKGMQRLEEENWLASQPWQNLILRPAGIYGPGRGVHVRVKEGLPPRAAGSAVVSRIHADDLAAALEAGLHSTLEGAWPCADEHPCSSEEITQWCARLLKKTARPPEQHPAVSGRTVDGRKLRELLGLVLLYPDYFAGILASLAEEG